MADLPHRHLLDASALLALLHREPGWDAVAAALDGAAISAVNWSEVLQKAGSRGVDIGPMQSDLLDLGVEVLAFGADEAEAAARGWLEGATALSLGDRACIGTARLQHWTVVTADRDWPSLGLDVTIQLIR